MNWEGVVVYDTESDGFVGEATQIHCVSWTHMDSDTNKVHSRYGNSIEEGLSALSNARIIIAHNECKHDIPLIKQLYPEWVAPQTIDSYILSCLLSPDRAGGHSLHAWARRLGGEQKVVHEDWTVFSLAMLHRCESDVRLNAKVMRVLARECYGELEGYDMYNFDFGE